MQGHPDRLRRRCIELNGIGAGKPHPRSQRILEMRKLRTDEIKDRHALPLVADKKLLARGKPPNTLGEKLNEFVSSIRSRRLAHDGLDHGKEILGAMIDFPKRVRHLLFSLFSPCDVESD